MVPKLANRGRTEKRRVRRYDAHSDEKKNHDAEPVQDIEAADSEDDTSSQPDDLDEEDDVPAPTTGAYNTLLQSLGTNENDDQPRKRRRLSGSERVANGLEAGGSDGEDSTNNGEIEDVGDEQDSKDMDEDDSKDEDEDLSSDPYSIHFPPTTDAILDAALQHAGEGAFRTTTSEQSSFRLSRGVLPSNQGQSGSSISIKRLPLKQKLRSVVSKLDLPQEKQHDALVSTMFGYEDLLYAAPDATSSPAVRDLISLHVLNHILKGRDRVLRNNAKAAKSEQDGDEFLRDQGFTRPKVLFLLETRQRAYEWITSILSIFEPEQKENWSRVKDSFYGEPHLSATMPEDYLDLFDGNSDNDFRLGLKFTRKTVKFFAAFYSADILFCSPLGLRRIIANSDPKKRDSDFLSSIEVCIFDQTHAMQMQNWSHVTFCAEHLNLQPKDAHGMDFNRVKTWYLDEHARYFRQTIVLTSYITPEITNLFNTHCRNLSGRVKLHPTYAGALQTLSFSSSIKQTFSRFDSASPASEPDARFNFFTSAILPSLVKQASLSSTVSPSGILLFVPSYLDFVRVRNHFAASSATENISFGQLSEYSSVSEARRARSHLVSGRNSVLVYSGRAHHFHRYRIAGVKRVYWYGLPDDPIFYGEVLGFVGRTVDEGKAEARNVSCRAAFCKWDALRLERIVGSARVRQMIGDRAGDTFEFV